LAAVVQRFHFKSCNFIASFKQPVVDKYFFTLFLSVFSATVIAQVKPVDSIPQPVPNSGCTGTPLIVLHPQSQTACPGSAVQFIAGAGPWGRNLWQRSTDGGATWVMVPGTDQYGGVLGGVGNDTLLVENITPGMSGDKYRWVAYPSPVSCTAPAYSLVATLAISSNTIINTQPADVLNACIGSSASFTAFATGGSITYQWQLSTDGGAAFTNILAATQPIFNLPSVDYSMNNYRYRCSIGSPCSTQLVSSVAILTVNPAAFQITSQPSGLGACPGTTAQFAVQASGNNLVYQWQKKYYAGESFSDIPGANATVYTTGTVVHSANDSVYRCRIGGNCSGNLYSSEAVLTTYPEPLIQGKVYGYYINRGACAGNTISYGICNNVYPAYKIYFQWQVSTDNGIVFNDIPGESACNYSFTAVSGMNNNKYRCRIYNPCYNKYTDTATLLMNVPVAITQQPANTTTCTGAYAYFTVNATGSVTAYKWQVSTDGGINFTDGNLQQYQNQNGLNLPGVTTAMSGNRYRCIVQSSCAVPDTSQPANLLVFPLPNLGQDTATTVSCQQCTANIAAMYNTAVYTSAAWNTPDAYTAPAGNYTLTVTNGIACTDQANVSVNFTDGLVTRLCRNGMTTLTSDVTGSSYQWQQTGISAAGSGGDTTTFTDIYGAYSQSIKLTNTAFSGNLVKYRCRVNGNSYSNVFSLKLTSLWTGNADNNWSNAANWGCRTVPDSFTDVVINAGTVVVNVNATVNTLTIKPGVNFSVAPGVTLTVLH
jgi:hypothetical protein